MKRTNGFTLLEVLGTLVVFGMLLAGLTRAVHYGAAAWRTQERIADGHGDLDAVERTLRHMIEVMDPGDGVDPAPIAATGQSIEFVTVLPDAVGTFPILHAKVTLLVDTRRQLVLRWRPYSHAERLRPAPPQNTTVLADNVADLELSYLRPTGGWIPTWNDRDLPALVRIRLVFSPGDRRNWPDIVVAPVLDPP